MGALKSSIMENYLTPEEMAEYERIVAAEHMKAVSGIDLTDIRAVTPEQFTILSPEEKDRAYAYLHKISLQIAQQ